MTTTKEPKFPKPSMLAAAAGELENISAEGAAPKTRLKDSKNAHEIYTKLRRADRDSAWNRRIVQEMFDGAPPYDGRQLKSLGQAHRFNLNFGEAAAQKEASLTAYQDLTNSVPQMVQVRIDPKKEPDPTIRGDKECSIAEEFHRLLKRWNQFEFNVQLLSDHFVAHGVGVAYFDNPDDWRFRVAGLGDFLFPRGTEANEEAVEIAIGTRKYQVHELYKYIEDPKNAAALGWNVEIVRECILNAHINDATGTTIKWEEFEREVKNNDLSVSYAKAKVVTVNHVWVKEFDGTVSHYIADEENRVNDFLFKKPSRFKSMEQALIVFPYGIGNGSIHSIRGLGFKIFNHVKASNQLQNALLDSAFLHNSLLVQTEDADDLTNLSLASFGPISALPPGVKMAETQFSNKAADALGVVNHLAMQIQNNTGSYRSRAIEPSGQERTKFEVQAQLEHEGLLSTSAMNLFYLPWGRLLREVFRRVANPDYKDGMPGFEEVDEFRSRLRDRGVSIQDLKAVTDVTPMRAVGYGSAQMRLLAFDEMMQFIGALDEQGRNNLLRDRVAQRVGYEMVDRYIPKIGVSRPPLDAQIAALEDADFKLGVSIEPMPGQLHFVHAQAHLAAMQQTAQMFQVGQIDPKSALQHFIVAVPHTQKHLVQVAQDKTREQEFAQMKDALNAVMQLAQHLQHNVQTQDAAQQGVQPQLSPEEQQKLQAKAMEMQQIQEEHALKMRIEAERAQQKLAIKDAEAAVKIRQTQPTAPAPAPQQ